MPHVCSIGNVLTSNSHWICIKKKKKRGMIQWLLDTIISALKDICEMFIYIVYNITLY